MKPLGKSYYRISTTVYIEFYKILKDEFKKEWVKAGGAPETDPGVWELYFQRDGKDVSLFREIFGQYHDHFYRAYKKVMNLISKNQKLEELYIDIKKKPFNKALEYLNCKKDSFVDSMEEFYDVYKITLDAKSHQDLLKQKIALKIHKETAIGTPKTTEFYSDETSDIERNNVFAKFSGRDLADASSSGDQLVFKQELTYLTADTKMMAKVRHYLMTHKWWIYYSTDNRYYNAYKEGYWPFFRAVLSFTTDQDSEFGKIILENNFDINTVSYEGKIDFESSSLTVLVLNLKYQVTQGAHLNIKINIGKGDGDLFLGQFLNYNEEGSIFSGNLVMQKIDSSKNSNPQPKRYAIADGSDPKEYPEIKLLLPFFADQSQNFRRTPEQIYSLDKFVTMFN